MDFSTSPAGKRKYKDKFSNKKDQGHCHCNQLYFTGAVDASTTNYLYSEDVFDNKAPFHHDQDFGSGTVAGQTISPSPLFRMGASYLAHRDMEMIDIMGWFTCNDADGTNTSTVTLAVCKATFTENNTTAIQPVVLGEFSVTSLDNNSKLIKLDNTKFTSTKVTKGDTIFTMIKANNADDDIYWRTVVNYK
jgi:hypothetical protein